MLTERQFIEAMIDGVIVARDSLDERRRAAMRERKKLPIMRQPLDAGYWYQEDCRLADRLAALEKQLAELDKRERR